jgi:hypothetical protein
MVVAAVATSCGSASSSERVDPMDQIRSAVEHAQESRTFRVRGQLLTKGTALTWEGVVAGDDEQYTATVGRVPFETRRLDGVGWFRRLDRQESWRDFPNDGPIDLGVLLRGVPEGIGHGDGRYTITLSFGEGVDVLRALAHSPSTGPTTADVTLSDDVISNIMLYLGGGATASLALWDYGADLAVEPVRVDG